MGFLAPWFLGGLALLGFPVFVHLLRKHVTTPRPVSSLMFFERGVQSSTRHHRLKHLVLFVLRFAFVLLLVLAFADPFIRRAASNSSEDLLLIVVDNSFSMRAANHLDEAKKDALAVLNTRKAAQRVQIVALGGQVQILTSPLADPLLAAAALQSIQPGDGHASFDQLAQTVRSLAQANGSGINLHLFSDLQRSAMPQNFADMTLPDPVTLHLHSVGPPTGLSNWTVDNVEAPTQLSDPKDPRRSRVRAVIAGYNTPAAAKNVTLIINEKVMATRSVNVPPGGRATVDFAPLDVGYGLNRCEVRIDGNDALPGDDTAFFTVRRSDPERVLFVHQPRDARSATYFGAALRSAPESSFVLQSVSEDQTADFDPSRFAFVVLSDAVDVPAIFEHTLAQYVSKGGSVLIALGTGGSRGASIPVWGGTVLETHTYERSGHGASVGRVDFSHPALNDPQPASDNGGWDEVSFELANLVRAQGASIALQLSDGTPLLLDRTLGEGHVLLFTSAFDNLTNDLPLHPVFVAMVDRIARYLSGESNLGGSMRIGSSVQLDNNSATDHKPSPVEVVDPDGQRPLSLSASHTAQSLRLEKAGFYRIHFSTGRDAVIGVNPDRLESDLQPMPDDLQQLWTGGGSRRRNPGESTTSNENPRRSLTLWWFVLLGATIVVIAESVLASNYLGTQREEA
jgi:hypothetical protein